MALIRTGNKSGTVASHADAAYCGESTTGTVTAAHDGVIIFIGDIASLSCNGQTATATTIRVLGASPFNRFWAYMPVSEGDVVTWTNATGKTGGTSYIEVY